MASYRWVPKQRNYEHENRQRRCTRIPTSSESHPLAAAFSKEVTSKQPRTPGRRSITSAFVDPLSRALEGSDPLSQFASTDENNEASLTVAEPGEDVMQEWLKQRTTILGKFTTTEKLSITSSFLQGGEKLIVKHQINDKLKHRLQQLDEFEDNVSEHKGLSREDYVSRITQISQELHQAWAADQRVKALKIVIQCSKLLLETHPFMFYPSKFALITDILDNFGRMVFERIAEKGDIRLDNHELPMHFKPEFVPETARETCRNWIYKIASVRELLPRIYVELAILKSLSYLENSDFTGTLVRLSRAIRGVGDPLVAAYMRCYLMRVGREKYVTDRSFMAENIHDLLASYHQLYSPPIRAGLTIYQMDPAQYLSLYSPAFDWIFQTLGRSGQYEAMEAIWQHCFNLTDSSLLWQSMLSQFSADFVLPRCLELAVIITRSSSRGSFDHHLMTTMGQTLSRSLSCSAESNANKLLSVVWPYLSGLNDTDLYLHTMEAWMPYLLRHWRPKDISRIFNDLMLHLRPKAKSHQVSQLNNIVHSLASAEYVDYQSLLGSESFITFLDVYPDVNAKVEAAKMVFQQFLSTHGRPLSHAPTVENLLLLGKILHSTLNAMSVEDEKRQIAEIAISLIDRVDFGRDFQQMLSFYGDVRATFTNLDPVLAHLVQMINRLSMKTRQMVKEHNKRTNNFVRACGAFAFITIPAIACPMIRFDLYLLSSQVSLVNECFGQSDACLEGAINLIQELSPSEEQWIAANVSSLLSVLLVQPDTPGQSRLHYFRRVLRNIRTFSTNHAVPRLRLSVYMQALRLLSAFAQTSYIYHVPNVESNDQLYLGDEEFHEDLSNHGSQLLTEILNDVQQLGADNQLRQQSTACLDLFSVLLDTADLEAEPDLAKLAVKLYYLGRKHNQHDPDYAANLLEAVRIRANSSDVTFRQMLLSLQK